MPLLLGMSCKPHEAIDMGAIGNCRIADKKGSIL
jgi:hypothetical protein